MNRMPDDFQRRSARQDESYRLPRGLAANPARILTSDSLFRGTYEIGIEHQGALYRLKITRQGKLILNK